MKKVLSRKEELILVLKAVSLPVLVIEIEFDGKIYKPKDYFKLVEIIQEELRMLDIDNNI